MADPNYTQRVQQLQSSYLSGDDIYGPIIDQYKAQLEQIDESYTEAERKLSEEVGRDAALTEQGNVSWPEALVSAAPVLAGLLTGKNQQAFGMAGSAALATAKETGPATKEAMAVRAKRIDSSKNALDELRKEQAKIEQNLLNLGVKSSEATAENQNKKTKELLDIASKDENRIYQEGQERVRQGRMDARADRAMKGRLINSGGFDFADQVMQGIGGGGNTDGRNYGSPNIATSQQQVQEQPLNTSNQNIGVPTIRLNKDTRMFDLMSEDGTVIGSAPTQRALEVSLGQLRMATEDEKKMTSVAQEIFGEDWGAPKVSLPANSKERTEILSDLNRGKNESKRIDGIVFGSGDWLGSHLLSFDSVSGAEKNKYFRSLAQAREIEKAASELAKLYSNENISLDSTIVKQQEDRIALIFKEYYNLGAALSQAEEVKLRGSLGLPIKASDLAEIGVIGSISRAIRAANNPEVDRDRASDEMQKMSAFTQLETKANLASQLGAQVDMMQYVLGISGSKELDLAISSQGQRMYSYDARGQYVLSAPIAKKIKDRLAMMTNQEYDQCALRFGALEEMTERASSFGLAPSALGGEREVIYGGETYRASDLMAKLLQEERQRRLSQYGR